jgi:BolA protein
MEAIIQSKLRSSFPDIRHLQIIDFSDAGCSGAKIEITLVAPEFEGKPLLQCHRLVRKVLEEERKSIHALVLKTIPPSKWTPEETSS